MVKSLDKIWNNVLFFYARSVLVILIISEEGIQTYITGTPTYHHISHFDDMIPIYCQIKSVVYSAYPVNHSSTVTRYSRKGFS